MREYYGKSAKSYSQANGNLIILNPNIEKYITETTEKKTFLDVGCGNGYFYSVATQKGYSYSGVDVSPDMITQAKEIFPEGVFTVDDAKNLNTIPDDSFDIVLLSMVIPALGTNEDILSVFTSLKRVVKKDGKIIIATAHPCFDPYMQAILHLRNDVESDLSTYFKNNLSYSVSKDIQGNSFTFNDFHRTLQLNYQLIQKSGLYLIDLDECEPDISKKELDPDYYNKKRNFPTFLLFICNKDYPS